MKKLLRVSFLIIFLGTILNSYSDAKVLPIIEGSELLDTLASQNLEELDIMPELTACNYQYVGLENLKSLQNILIKEKSIYKDEWLMGYSIMFNYFNSMPYLKSDSKLKFTGQILTQRDQEKI